MPFKGERVVVRVDGHKFLAEYDRHDPIKWGSAPHVVWLLKSDNGERGQKYAIKDRNLYRFGCSSAYSEYLPGL